MKPPEWWRSVLRASIDVERRADVLGDLEEEFAERAAASSPRHARRWYRRQALGFAAKRLLRMPASALLSPTDLRLGVRLARRQPVATLTSVFALAAAIAISVGAFTFARNFVFPELRMPGGDRLQQIRMTRLTPGTSEHPRPVEVQAWMRDARLLDDIGAFQFASPPIEAGGTGPKPVDGALITPAPFARLAPPPLMGRHLTTADTEPGAAPVVVIGEQFWRGRLSSDPGVIGRQIRVSGELREVVGVLPAAWRFPVMQNIWLPLSIERLSPGDGSTLVVWIVPKADAGTSAVVSELTALARHVASPEERDATALEVLPYVDAFTGGVASTLSVLTLGLLLVFLAAVSLNVANLMLARCASRAEELAVRAALGASRARIAGQLFVESLVTSVAAAIVGIFAMERTLTMVRGRMGTNGPFWLDLSLDGWVALYAAGLAVMASLLIGVVPALTVTRQRTLSPGGRVAPVALGRFASTLLAVQLATSLAFIAIAGLFAEGVQAQRVRTPAADETNVMTAVLYRDRLLTEPRLPWGSAPLFELRRRLEDSLAAVPGVDRVAVSLSVPRGDRHIETVEVDGLAGPPVRVQQLLAGPGFLEVLKVPVIDGRPLADADARPGAPPVAVVSQRFVDIALHGRPAVGRRIRDVRSDANTPPSTWTEIVGVVADIGMDPGDRLSSGEVFEPLIGTDFMYVLLRTSGPAALERPLREAIAATDPRIRVTDVQPLADVGWESRTALGVGSGVLVGLGTMALLLSLAGIYALASLTVTSRTREIGIRIALGASSRSMLTSLLRPTLRQLAIGVTGGALLASAAARALVLLPFSLPRSVTLFVVVSALIVLLATGMALWSPARRALRIQPIDALRGD